MSTRPPCPRCGFIHSPKHAVAVGRFSGLKGYRAVSGGPTRETREEADRDHCDHLRRRSEQANPAQPALFDAATTKPELRTPDTPRPEPEPFPAARMEEAARAKAWHDFLAQVRMSLLVWQIDDDLHGSCEHVLAWLHRCRDELNALGAAS